MEVYLRKATKSDKEALASAYERSIGLLSSWASPPKDLDQYLLNENLYLVCLTQSTEIVGVFNITEIVRGLFQSGYLGYCAFVPYQNKGYMKKGFKLLIKEAFDVLKLHRLEANIQSGNLPSIKLVKATGFSKEGYSPKYLKIGAEWKDHERWAIINDVWVEPSGKRN